MYLWRISRRHDLKGEGGLRAAGRWHERGHAIVYLVESPAGALLETCVHTSSNDVPPSFTLLKVFVAGKVSIESFDLSKLPPNWVDDVELTRMAGTEWLRSLGSALLRVPSALVPETFNLLLNPLHSDAGLMRVDSAYAYPFDPRIKT